MLYKIRASKIKFRKLEATEKLVNGIVRRNDSSFVLTNSLGIRPIVGNVMRVRRVFPHRCFACSFTSASITNSGLTVPEGKLAAGSTNSESCCIKAGQGLGPKLCRPVTSNPKQISCVVYDFALWVFACSPRLVWFYSSQLPPLTRIALFREQS